MKDLTYTEKPVILRLMQNRMAALSVYFILFLILIALLAPILANDKPVYVNYNGKIFFPAFSGEEFGKVIDEKSGNEISFRFSELKDNNHKLITVIMPMIPFAPLKSDLNNAGYTNPFEEQFGKRNDKEIRLHGFEKHLLGTGKRGEDLLAGLIHGTKISLTVGLFSMTIAGLIGILLGSLAGYFGDHQTKTKRGKNVMLLIGLLPAWFYGFHIRNFILTDALQLSPFSFAFQLFISICIFAMVLALFFLSGNFLKIIPYFNKSVSFPVDSIISRIIEILISLPSIILILSIAAIARPSLVNLIIIIGLTSWTDIARLTRAEILRLKNLDFIQTAKGLGFKESRILFKHALPNALAPAMVAIVFGIASAILAESSLSFLGIGVPQDIVTWGSLLASGRENFQAWWLVVFPGLAIFLTVTAYNLVGEKLRDLMDPKMRG